MVELIINGVAVDFDPSQLNFSFDLSDPIEGGMVSRNYAGTIDLERTHNNDLLFRSWRFPHNFARDQMSAILIIGGKNYGKFSVGVEVTPSGYKLRLSEELSSFVNIGYSPKNSAVGEFNELVNGRLSGKKLITELSKRYGYSVDFGTIGEQYRFPAEEVADISSLIGKSQLFDSSTSLGTMYPNDSIFVRMSNNPDEVRSLTIWAGVLEIPAAGNEGVALSRIEFAGMNWGTNGNLRGGVWMYHIEKQGVINLSQLKFGLTVYPSAGLGAIKGAVWATPPTVTDISGSNIVLLGRNYGGSKLIDYVHDLATTNLHGYSINGNKVMFFPLLSSGGVWIGDKIKSLVRIYPFAKSARSINIEWKDSIIIVDYDESSQQRSVGGFSPKLETHRYGVPTIVHYHNSPAPWSSEGIGKFENYLESLTGVAIDVNVVITHSFFESLSTTRVVESHEYGRCILLGVSGYSPSTGTAVVKMLKLK